MSKTSGPPGAQEWGHRRLSGRPGPWALAGWGQRGPDGWVPGLQAGQAADSLLPGELSDLLSPPPLPGCGDGDGAASLSSLLPATCFTAEAAVPSTEGAQGGGWGPPGIFSREGTEASGTPGVSGEVDTWSPGRSGSWGEEPWTLLLCRGIGPNCGVPGKRARPVRDGGGEGGDAVAGGSLNGNPGN